MKLKFKTLLVNILLLFSFSSHLFAQEGLESNENVEYSSNSVARIPNYEQLYKQRIWTRVDLGQKINKGFFAKDNEISQVILNGIESDKIKNIYWGDSLKRKMTKAEFMLRLNKNKAVVEEDQPLYEVDYPYFEGDVVEYKGKNYICKKDLSSNDVGIAPSSDANLWGIYSGGEVEKYFSSEMSVIEIMEDVIFDKRRSRQFRDIISIKLIVPGKYSNDGANYYIATFSYKDLEFFFRENPETAYWYNKQNSAANRNLADAFLLRLFHGELYKVQNSDDLPITSYYGGNIKLGLMASQWEEMKILEREHNLWSY